MCYKLGKENLKTSPVCPTCGFRPSDEKGAVSGAAELDAIDEEMDKLLDSWAETIVSNLGDPTVRKASSYSTLPRRRPSRNW